MSKLDMMVGYEMNFYEKKFEEKARTERKVFSFDAEISMPSQEESVVEEENIENNIQEF